jgi:hypothetical protein
MPSFASSGNSPPANSMTGGYANSPFYRHRAKRVGGSSMTAESSNDDTTVLRKDRKKRESLHHEEHAKRRRVE